jgi:two-component system response regulator NreC
MSSHVPETAGVASAARGLITVVIADDHTVIRKGLRMLIDHEQDLEVVAEAGNVPEAERATRAHKPSVLILDLNMPGGSSLEAIAHLRRRVPETGIVILTMQDDAAFARRSLRAGALGFVLKEASDGELVLAIRLAAAGQTYLNPQLGARMAAMRDAPSAPSHDLSDREVEVLRLIALGYTNTEIAERLFLSIRTVETHRAHIQRKIRRHSRAGLVRYALDHRLVKVP